MSTRQNKKRKGRNNVNNRERTVTTLTEDPNTPYLIPTPSEEPAGANLMSSPFSVASSSGANPNPSGFPIPGNFGFGFNSYIGPMHGNVHHPQQGQQFYPQSPQPLMPPGQNDLEVLEKLKDMIKNGQHEFYRAVPQPAALASIYLGPANQSQVPHHPEQVPPDYPGSGYNPNAYDIPAAGNTGATSPPDTARRPLRIQTKDNREASGPPKPVGPPTGGSSQVSNNSTQTSVPQTPINRYSNNSKTENSPSTGIKSAHHPLDTATPATPVGSGAVPFSPRPSNLDSTAHNNTANNTRPQEGQIPSNIPKHEKRPPADRPSTGESTYGPVSTEVPSIKSSLFDGKEEAAQNTGWPQRDGPPAQDDRRHRQDSERPVPVPTPTRPSGDVNDDTRQASVDASRPPPPRDQRFNDRERERERDRDRRDWERDSRRSDSRFRDDRSRILDTRRLPPDQRHYEPRYNDLPSRRYDSKPGVDEPMTIDKRPDPARPAVSSDDRSARPIPVDDRTVRPPTDDRAPPARAPIPDIRLTRVPPADDRHVRPGPAEDRRANRPQATVQPVEEGATAGDDRAGARGPPHSASAVEDRNTRPTVPLEERISRPPPSLQDRLSQPPSSARGDNSRSARQPSLEARLSHVPTVSADHAVRSQLTDDRVARPHPPSSAPDRPARPGPLEERTRVLGEPPRAPATHDERERLAQQDERPVRPAPSERDQYVRRITPVPERGPPPLPRSSGYRRSSPNVRDDTRPTKTSPSPARDFRAARELSRERSDLRPVYRPEHDRGFNDDRRSGPDAMDQDSPTRFPDSRVSYTRRFSPPSAADLARDRARSFYSNSSPPRVAAETPPYDVDGDRRYPPPGERRDWSYQPQQPFNDRRREWSQSEEDIYWKSRRTWDRNSTTPLDRDRFDRDVPPPPPTGRSNGWETREERERRSFPGGASSPPRTFDGAQRPLSSRLTDGYPSSGPGAEDRLPYPSRDMSRYIPGPTDSAPLPFSRVRQRSPSPVGRRPVVGPGGPGDDMRPPPSKRAREDPPYRSGYYPPSPQGPPPLNRDASRRGSLGDYSARVATPPPSSASSYYDSRGGPPTLSGGSGNLSGLDEREYIGRDRGPGIDYGPGPSSYGRPRSPAPGSGLAPAAYGRGAYGRSGDPRDDRRYNMAPPPPRTA